MRGAWNKILEKAGDGAMKRWMVLFFGSAGIVGVLALGLFPFFASQNEGQDSPSIISSLPSSSEPLPSPLLKPPPESDAVRLFLLLKEREPEVYKVLMARTKEVLEGTKSLQEVQIETAPALQRVFSDYLPYARPEALIIFTRQFIALSTMLRAHSPEACRRYIIGEEIQDIIAVMPSPPPSELMEGNIRALVEILETATPERSIPTANEVSSLFSRILTPSLQLTAEEIALVTDPGDPRTDPEKLCTAFIRFYQKILDLPPNDADQVLRYRFFHVAQDEKEEDKGGQYDLRLSTDRSKIVLSGYIGRGVAREFEKMLTDTPTVRDIFTNGELGGLVGEARAIRDLIHARKLTTRVTKECVSACTIVFLGGAKRYLYPGGKIGFHRYTSPGFPPLDQPDEKKDLLSFGVPAVFANRVFEVPTEELWYPDKQELFDSNITTILNPPPYR